MRKFIVILITLSFAFLLPESVFALGEACNNPGQPCGGSPNVICLYNSQWTGTNDPSRPQFTCQDYSQQTSNLGTAIGQNFQGGITTTFGNFITKILPQIYVAALILVLIYLTWGAYRYMLSGGDAKAVQGAKSQITWAVIGMIIVFLSYGIFQLVNSLLNSIY
jgi:hypothetical protein